jgi:signal peptidase I
MAMQRFNVMEESMTPTLVPGDEFVAISTRVAEPGNIVALPHPRRENFWLVKRLAGVAGDTVITDKACTPSSTTRHGCFQTILRPEQSTPEPSD